MWFVSGDLVLLSFANSLLEVLDQPNVASNLVEIEQQICLGRRPQRDRKSLRSLYPRDLVVR